MTETSRTNRNPTSIYCCTLQTPLPPTVTFAPVDGDITNDNTTDITLQFNETVRKINDTPITPDNAHTLVTLTESGDAANIATQTNTTFSSNTVTINPTNNLPDGIYTITLPANTVEDTNNNAITLSKTSDIHHRRHRPFPFLHKTP